MVSFDVEGLFASTPLDECIHLAITYIYQGYPGLKIWDMFFDYMNARHPSIRFTMERKIEIIVSRHC